MDYIPDLLKSLVSQHRSPKIAEREFERLIDSDLTLKDSYLLWCEEEELNPKEAYISFIEELLEEEDEVWNSFRDYDDFH